MNDKQLEELSDTILSLTNEIVEAVAYIINGHEATSAEAIISAVGLAAGRINKTAVKNANEIFGEDNCFMNLAEASYMYELNGKYDKD